MERKTQSFRDVWRRIAEEAERESPDAVEQLEDFRSAFALARELAHARKAKKLSQVEVSERTGIAQSEISKIESGTANPTAQTLSRLAAAYHMRVGLIVEKRVYAKPSSKTVKPRSKAAD